MSKNVAKRQTSSKPAKAAQAGALIAPETGRQNTPGHWPAMNAELRPIGELTPYAQNSRTHSPEQVQQIAASMLRFGWTIAVLIDEEGGLIAGHGRIMAAEKLVAAGHAAFRMAPTVKAIGWTEDEKRAYVIADNKLTDNGGWDQVKLGSEIRLLADAGFDMPLLGFSEEELAPLLAEPPTEGETDPDEAPDAPTFPTTRPGDVWIMGRHRIICGDATNPDDVARVLAGVMPTLMVTDPPYGVDYDPAWRAKASGEGKLNRQDEDKNRHAGTPNFLAGGEVQNDDRPDWREAWALFPGHVAYVWCASLHNHRVAESLEATDFELRSQVIWAKAHFAIGRGHYHWQHEPCWYAVRDGGGKTWQGARDQSTIWKIDGGMGFRSKTEGVDARTGHGTQKPVECMKRPIENNTAPGQAVYDPFCGSGTTIIAAEMTSRACHAIELAPAYVDVCVTRWEKFAGKAAVLEGDGRTFLEVMAERNPNGGAITARVG